MYLREDVYNLKF